MKKNEKKDLEDFRKSLDEINEEDFDGDTCFQDLSVKEKLIWLSELNYFNFIIKNR